MEVGKELRKKEGRKVGEECEEGGREGGREGGKEGERVGRREEGREGKVCWRRKNVGIKIKFELYFNYFQLPEHDCLQLRFYLPSFY